MLKRVITAVVALLVFVPCMIFSDTWVYPIFFALCGVIAVFEMARCVGLHKNLWVTIPLYLYAAFTPCFIRFLSRTFTEGFGEAVILTALLILIWLLAVVVFKKGTLDITAVSTFYFGCLYAVGGFACAVTVHDFHDILGGYFYLMIFVGAWVTDTFAYFAGRLFGKHKLIPEISPKKTVEGAIGGIVFCVLAFIGYALLYNNLWVTESGHTLSIPALAVMGLVISVVSMIGDLAMSAVKRHYGIKDYGRLLPGHGGILDRFDSVLAVAILLETFRLFAGMFTGLFLI